MEISPHMKTQLDRLRALYPELKSYPDGQLLQMFRDTMEQIAGAIAPDAVTGEQSAAQPRLGEEQALAIGYSNLGQIHFQQGDFDKAIGMHERALEIHLRIGNRPGSAQDYGNLAICYRQKGDTARALRFYKKDLEITEEIGDQHGVAVSCFNLGLLYFRKIGDCKEARVHFAKARELFQIAGDASLAERAEQALRGL